MEFDGRGDKVKTTRELMSKLGMDDDDDGAYNSSSVGGGKEADDDDFDLLDLMDSAGK